MSGLFLLSVEGSGGVKPVDISLYILVISARRGDSLTLGIYYDIIRLGIAVEAIALKITPLRTHGAECFFIPFGVGHGDR